MTSWQHLFPKPPDHSKPTETVIQSALTRSPRLQQLLAGSDRHQDPVLLIVNDPQRATKTRVILERLAIHCGKIGIQPLFRALVATGTHRFETSEQRRFEQDTFGGCGLQIDSVSWHDAVDAAGLAEIGGVKLNRLLADSTYILAIGGLEPHYFAGVAGPHKTLTVGCLSREAIERNHIGALHPDSDLMRLAGNPIHDGFVAILAKFTEAKKTVCAIGEVSSGSELVAAAVGDPLEVLDELLPVVRSVYLHTVTKPVDVLHLRVGPPLDRHLYQAEKAFKNNHLAVRDAGAIILEANCREGIGPSAFFELLQAAPTHEEALKVVDRRGYRLGDHKAVKLRQLTDPGRRNVHIALVSDGVTEQEAATAGMRRCEHFDEALSWLAQTVPGHLQNGLLIDDAAVTCVLPDS